MKNLKRGMLFLSLVVAAPAFSCTKDGSEGFLPKNNLWISVDDKNAKGIDEVQFNSVIDKIEGIYAPIVATYGAELQVVRRWTDGTVNAYAEQIGSSWKVSMFGGLARHRTVTADGFALVVCHELGHHIGGAPKYSSDPWASNEGQSDYFATLKCLRRVWMDENNEEIIKNLDAPRALVDACSANWANSTDRAICIRGGMAGESVAKLFAALSWGRQPRFDTPDTRVVSRTSDSHPATQCRLDTYFQGALCEKTFTEDVAQNEEVAGTCHGVTGQTSGLRPLCWFKPTAK
jgi:hypothetical protein